MFQLNNKHSFISALAVLVLFLGIACNKADTSGSDPENIKHPRILLFDGEEEQIKKIVQEDATWRKMHHAILDECSKITGEPLLEREMTGRRLLSVSRELLRRVFYLSYAYRMTGQEEYLIKAESE
ncbi:MAG: hypothetical protein K0B11_19025, partial [Mariniphaga sp.]|nr:hypothetical protein [Mariniphaga sp.]